MIGYQIYIRSYHDSNADGIGDLGGITEKMQYIHSLGVDHIWITPFFQSPMDDNGYDISNYTEVNRIFGSNNDLKVLIDSAHSYGIKVIMDLVLNHTSDEHEWFKYSEKKIEPYTDYYVWRDGREIDGKMCPPNEWQSFFCGNAWRYSEVRGQYYLHLFSNKMPDLNYECDDVIGEIERIVRHYCSMGIDGFRLDAVSHIAKDMTLADCLVPQYKHFSNLPLAHEYLRRISKTFQECGAVTMGELGGDPTEEDVERYINGEIDAVFTFEQLGVMDDNGVIDRAKLVEMLKYKNSYNGGAMLFWMNHDYPRLLSRVCGEDDPKNAQLCLATLMYMLRGNVMIYNGEEIGMENYPFASIDQFRDVNAKNMIAESKDKDAILQHLRKYSRDNARTTMQWDDSTYGGFGKGVPVALVGDYMHCNVRIQEDDPHSTLNEYRRIIATRKAIEEYIQSGQYNFVAEGGVVGYSISTGKGTIIVRANLSKLDQVMPCGKILYSNMPCGSTLEPYQVVVIKREK